MYNFIIGCVRYDIILNSLLLFIYMSAPAQLVEKPAAGGRCGGDGGSQQIVCSSITQSAARDMHKLRSADSIYR